MESIRRPTHAFRRWWRWWAYEAYAADERSLAVVRIAYGVYVLVVAAHCVARIGWVTGMPASFFDPPLGPMRVFSSVPAPWALHLICAATYVAAAAVLLGYRTGVSSTILTILLLLGNGFSYSFSKINHSSVVAIAPVLLALAGWGNQWSADARRNPRRSVRAWPIALLALIIGAAMFAGGLPKLLSGWLAWDDHATRDHLIRHFVGQGHRDLLAPFFVRIDASALWEAMDWATLTFELGLLPAVLFPRVFRAFLVLAVFFHVGVLFLFNIAFSGQLLTYAPFAPWSRILPRGSPAQGSCGAIQLPSGTVTLAAAVAMGLLAYLVPVGVRMMTIPTGDSVRLADFIWILSAGAVASYIAARGARRLYRRTFLSS